MTTLKIFETRLVRVPYEQFYGALDHDEWKRRVDDFAKVLSDKFGPNWNQIGPSYKEDRVNDCVELQYQRVYEVSE